jgi:hypothetical protein
MLVGRSRLTIEQFGRIRRRVVRQAKRGVQ